MKSASMSSRRLGIALMLALFSTSGCFAQESAPVDPPVARETDSDRWPAIDPPPEALAPAKPTQGTPATQRRPAPPAAASKPSAAAPAGTAEEKPEAGVGNIWAPTAAPAAEAASAPRVSTGADGVSLPAVIDDRGYMVDLKGMTLYTFDGDTRPNSSTCFGVCETLWPPYFAPDGAAAVGEFTITFRRDGTLQWAHRGKPLYRWARDEKPGDVTGDNVNKVWHLIRN